jgi:hypothetical protein
VLIDRHFRNRPALNGFIVALKVTIVILVIGLGFAYINRANYVPSFRPTPASSATSAGAASCAPRA